MADPSTDEIAEAVKALIAAALPAADVRRNQDKPAHIGPGGMVILRDGDLGEPVAVDLSPLTYNYEWRLPLEVAALKSDTLTSAQVLRQLLLPPIGAAVAADRFLGGLVEFLEVEAPALDDLEVPGSSPGQWADAAIVVHFSTTNPLG